MSLTRAQWLEMWECLKKIENHSQGIISDIRREKIRMEVEKIRAMIQEVVGQLR